MPLKDEQLDKLTERERQTFLMLLTSRIAKSALTIDEYIQMRALQGTDLNIIKDELLTDLKEGGRLFGEFRRTIKATVRGSVNRARDNAYFSEEGLDDTYRWVAVMIRTCPDCLARHGQIKIWSEWEAEGLPRSGNTVCRDNCHCVLVPEKFTEYEPIKREKR